MKHEFKVTKSKDQTVYTLESATGGSSSTAGGASVSKPLGGVHRRGDNLLAQEADKKKVPATTPRNFVAKNAKTSGAGAHVDKKKAEKQGNVKHKNKDMDMAETGPAATTAMQQGLDPTEVGIADRTDKHNTRWNAINTQKAQQMLAKGLDPTKTADWDKFGQQGVAEGDRPFRGVGGAFNRGDDERHDLDPTEWYIVKDGKMFKTSVYPNQVQLAIAQGYSRTRDEAKAKAGEQGVAEGYNPVEKDYEQWEQALYPHGNGASAFDLINGDETTIRNILTYVNQNRAVLGYEVSPETGRTVKDAIIDIRNEFPQLYRAAQQPQGVAEGSGANKTHLAMAYLKAVVMAPMGTPEKRRILNWQQILSNQFDIEMDPATLAQMLPQFDSMLQAGKLDKLQNRMASRGELEIGESNQGVAEGDRPGMKDGRPYSDPLRRHPGNDSYMTPEYLIQKYQDELKKIAAGPYKRTKDVAMYKARIAKLQRQQGVAEGVRDLGYDAQSLIMKLRRDVEEKRLQPTPQAVLAAARELAGDMEFAPQLLVKQVLGKGMAEGFNGEYDDEAGMAHSNLLTTARAVLGLLKTIKDRDNLPEWGQEKIAKAEMMLVGVWDYLQSQKELGNDPQQGVAEGEKKGLYYYVNKRKKAGTSRPASSPKAPTAQAWKDAAKTAKKEGAAEGSLNEGKGLAGELAGFLKSNGFKGPYRLGKLPKWAADLSEFDKNSLIMVQGNDVEYDEFVLDAGFGELYMGGEGGITKMTEKAIMNNVAYVSKGMAEGGEKDRQWSNKDMERLRVATRDFDDIMASDGPDQTKHDLIKKRIQTKPMAGPKGVLPEEGVAEGGVKDLVYDLKTMSDEEFMAHYKMSKADARRQASSVGEVAPPGWEKTVKAMKKHDEIDNPFALANWMKNKGMKSHKEDAYMEELAAKIAEKLDPNADVDVWVQDFQKADPNKYHQFKNKTPEKKAQMATSARYAAKNPSKK
jgi:hypothetical protein